MTLPKQLSDRGGLGLAELEDPARDNEGHGEDDDDGPARAKASQDVLKAALMNAWALWSLHGHSLAYVIASLVNGDSLLAFFYCILALWVARSSTLALTPGAPRLRHQLLACLAAAPLAAETVWHGLCAYGVAGGGGRLDLALHVIFHGMPDSEVCLDLVWSWVETCMAVVALTHWAVSELVGPLPPADVMLQEPLTVKVARARPVSKLVFWLILCAIPDCNLFASCYYLIAILLILSLAIDTEGLLPTSRLLRPVRPLAWVALSVAVVHIFSGCCSAVVLYLASSVFEVRAIRRVTIFLFAPSSDDSWRYAQCLLAMALLTELRRELLVGVAMPASPAPPPAAGGAEGGGQEVELLPVTDAASLAAGPDAAAAPEDLEADLDLQPSLSAAANDLDPTDTVSVAPSMSVSTALGLQRGRSARSREGVLTFEADHEHSEAWQRAFNAELAALAAETGMLASDEDPAGALPSLASLCAWPLVWPSLPALPLMLAGLVSLRRPLHVLPKVLVLAALRYEATLCVACYAYAVWCDFNGELHWWQSQLGVLTGISNPHQGLNQAKAMRSAALALLPLLTLCMSCGARWGMRSRTGHRRGFSPMDGVRKCGFWALFSLRVVTVVAAMTMALWRGPDSMSSFIQIGYLGWFLALLAGEQISLVVTGWDVIRGSFEVWLALLLYSGGMAQATLLWQGLNMREFAAIGLLRTDSGTPLLISQLWPHLLIAMLAALQARTLKGQAAGNSSTAAAQVPSMVRALLIFTQFGLLLLVALLPPVSVDAFLFLVLFVGNVLIASVRVQPSLLLPGMRLIADLAWGLLPLRSILMLPVVQDWLEAVLPPNEFKWSWNTLALKATDVSHWRQVLMALLLLLSRALSGILEPALASLDQQMTATPLDARTAKRMRAARRWSPFMLILVAYVLTVSGGLNFLSSVQLVVVLLLLFFGQTRGQAGTFFAVTANLSLVGQYFCRFDLVQEQFSEESLQYWGLNWDISTLSRSIWLLLLAMCQRVIHERTRAAEEFDDVFGVPPPEEGAATELPTRMTVAELLAQAEEERLRAAAALKEEEEADGEVEADMGDLQHPAGSTQAPAAVAVDRRAVGYDVQLGAVATLGVAMYRKNLWSVAMSAMVGALVLSGHLYRRLPTFTAQRWLRSMAFVLLLAILWDITMEVWLPPNWGHPRPSREEIATWRLCEPFEPQPIPRRVDGTPCAWKEPLPSRSSDPPRSPKLPPQEPLPALPALRATTGGALGAAVAAAFEGGEGLHAYDTSVPVRSECATQRERCAADWAAWGSLEGTKGIPEFLVFLGLCLLLVADILLQWPAEVEPPPPTDSSMDSYKLAMIYGSALATWLSLLVAFLVKKQSDAIAMAYLWLLLYNLSAVGNSPLSASPVESMLWPARLIGAVNFMVIAASLAFQSPWIPCPYALVLPLVEPPNTKEGTATSWISAAQCVRLSQSSSSSIQLSGSQPVEGSHSWAILFQSLGLTKLPDDPAEDSTVVWNFVVFCAVILQRGSVARWRPLLEKHLAENRQRMSSRAQWYRDQVAAMRELQLSSWDTKRQVLLQKLRRLIAQHDAFRAMMDGRRQAFTEAEERERAHSTRVEDLCLQSGIRRWKVAQEEIKKKVHKVPRADGGQAAAAAAAGEEEAEEDEEEEDDEDDDKDAEWEEVEDLLRKFDAVAMAALEEAGHQHPDDPTNQASGETARQVERHAQAVVDRRVLEYLEKHKLWMARMITLAELKLARVRLLEGCREECSQLVEVSPQNSMSSSFTSRPARQTARRSYSGPADSHEPLLQPQQAAEARQPRRSSLSTAVVPREPLLPWAGAGLHRSEARGRATMPPMSTATAGAVAFAHRPPGLEGRHAAGTGTAGARAAGQPGITSNGGVGDDGSAGLEDGAAVGGAASRQLHELPAHAAGEQLPSTCGHAPFRSWDAEGGEASPTSAAANAATSGATEGHCEGPPSPASIRARTSLGTPTLPPLPEGKELQPLPATADKEGLELVPLGEDPGNVGQPAEEDVETEPQPGEIYMWVRGLLCDCIDDLMFISEDDETLHEHRKDNSLFLLFIKAMSSQTLLVLFAAATIQFVAYRSLMAAVSVSGVVLLLMAFPHVPWQVWMLLHWYNIAVVFLKVLFQLPVFCADGTFRLSAETTCEEDCTPTHSNPNAVPLVAMIGLVKVTTPDPADPTRRNSCGVTYGTLRGVLWADLLVCVMVLVNMLVARWSGRFDNRDALISLFEKHDRDRDRPGASPGAPNMAIRGQRSTSNMGAHAAAHRGARLGRLRANTRRIIEKTTNHCLEAAVKCYKGLISYVVGSSRLRRPAKDFYATRFLINMILLGIILFGWSEMAGTARTFTVSLMTNNFSGNQVITLGSGVLLSLVERVLYTWYRTDIWNFEDDGADADKSKEEQEAPARRGSLALEERLAQQADQSPGCWEGITGGYHGGKYRIISSVLQKMLLFGELILLHVVFVMMWRDNRRMAGAHLFKTYGNQQNSTASVFYLLSLIYLALTSLQLKYDVHVMRGGMRFTHSTDLAFKYVVRAYNALPFLHELRVLTDWTTTATSMNFFMWMKLEDAYLTLYTTRCDMEYRAWVRSFGTRQPWFEKLLMGGGLLTVLLVLLIGPVMFFSSLNRFFADNLVTMAELSVNLEVNTQRFGVRRMRLYSSMHAGIERIAQDSSTWPSIMREFTRDSQVEVPVNIQNVTFPQHADSLWMLPMSSRQQMADLIGSTDDVEGVKIMLSFIFERQITARATYDEEIELDWKETRDFADLLNNTNLPETTMIRINATKGTSAKQFSRYVRLTSSARVERTSNGDGERHEEVLLLSLHSEGRASEGGGGLEHWSLMMQSGDDEHRLVCVLMSDRVARTATAEDGSAEGVSMKSLYLGVVFTVGQFLRSYFKGSAQRVVYEEMPDTDLLMDLCNGVYVARIQGNLEYEYKLYHELIRIYRSPELLLRVCAPKALGTSQVAATSGSEASSSPPSGSGGASRHRMSRRGSELKATGRPSSLSTLERAGSRDSVSAGWRPGLPSARPRFTTQHTREASHFGERSPSPPQDGAGPRRRHARLLTDEGAEATNVEGRRPSR